MHIITPNIKARYAAVRLGGKHKTHGNLHVWCPNKSLSTALSLFLCLPCRLVVQCRGTVAKYQCVHTPLHLPCHRALTLLTRCPS